LGDKIIITLKCKLKQIKWIIHYFLVDHLDINLLLHLMTWESCSQGCFMISSAKIISSWLEKLGDQVFGRPGDGVEKLRVELVVGGGDLSPVFKLQTSSVIPK
jgi:hypothetical protein